RRPGRGCGPPGRWGRSTRGRARGRSSGLHSDSCGLKPLCLSLQWFHFATKRGVVVTNAQRMILSAVCAAAVSTVYAVQPVLETAGRELGLTPGALGWLAAAGQIGYFTGLILLVPLSDVLDRR